MTSREPTGQAISDEGLLKLIRTAIADPGEIANSSAAGVDLGVGG